MFMGEKRDVTLSRRDRNHCGAAWTAGVEIGCLRDPHGPEILDFAERTLTLSCSVLGQCYIFYFIFLFW